MAGVKAYLCAKLHLDPSNRLATIHQRHRQTDSTGQTDRQGNGPIAQGEPYCKQSPKNHCDDADGRLTCSPRLIPSGVFVSPCGIGIALMPLITLSRVVRSVRSN